jgi:protein N-lysine methyltransferase METTL21D
MDLSEDTKQMEYVQFNILGAETILIQQKQDTMQHGTTIWDSAKVLLRYFEKKFLKQIKSRAKWIELGAGCGLIAAALVKLGVEDVMVTDQPHIIPLLKLNVARNVASSACTVSALSWGEDKDLKNYSNDYDFIVGTDVIYCEELIQPLVCTMLHLSKKGTEVIIAHEVRDEQVYQSFLNSIDDTKAFVPVRQIKCQKLFKNACQDIVILRFSKL